MGCPHLVMIQPALLLHITQLSSLSMHDCSMIKLMLCAPISDLMPLNPYNYSLLFFPCNGQCAAAAPLAVASFCVRRPSVSTLCAWPPPHTALRYKYSHSSYYYLCVSCLLLSVKHLSRGQSVRSEQHYFIHSSAQTNPVNMR